MKKATELLALFIGIPFVVSMAIEFLPVWLSAPTTFIAFMFWVGVFIQIGEYKKEDEQKE